MCIYFENHFLLFPLCCHCSSNMIICIFLQFFCGFLPCDSLLHLVPCVYTYPYMYMFICIYVYILLWPVPSCCIICHVALTCCTAMLHSPVPLLDVAFLCPCYVVLSSFACCTVFICSEPWCLYIRTVSCCCHHVACVTFLSAMFHVCCLLGWTEFVMPTFWSLTWAACMVHVHSSLTSDLFTEPCWYMTFAFVSLLPWHMFC